MTTKEIIQQLVSSDIFLNQFFTTTVSDHTISIQSELTIDVDLSWIAVLDPTEVSTKVSFYSSKMSIDIAPITDPQTDNDINITIKNV